MPVPLNIEGQRALRDAKGHLRDLKLTLIRTKEGKLFLCKLTGGKKRAILKPIIILVKHVIMPARPYVRPTLARETGAIQTFIQLAMVDAFEGVV